MALRRAEFLEEMEQVVPWAELCALIEPVYPKAGQGRPPGGSGAHANSNDRRIGAQGIVYALLNSGAIGLVYSNISGFARPPIIPSGQCAVGVIVFSHLRQ
jgi:hypothetical protein